MPMTTQTALSVEVIKQYSGSETVKRRVRVNVPGKFFSALSPTDQKQDYVGEPIEFQERKKFDKHSKGWGAARVPLIPAPAFEWSATPRLSCQLTMQSM